MITFNDLKPGMVIVYKYPKKRGYDFRVVYEYISEVNLDNLRNYLLAVNGHSDRTLINMEYPLEHSISFDKTVANLTKDGVKITIADKETTEKIIKELCAEAL